MYEQEDTSCPYDNVEFPIRPTGTGTWPGPGSSANASSSSSSSSTSSSASSGNQTKFYGQHSLSRGGGVSRLAPLVEVEGAEGVENNNPSQDTILTTSTTSSPSPSTSSYLQNKTATYGGKGIIMNNAINKTGQSSSGTATTTTTSTTSSSPSTTSQTTVINSNAVKYTPPMTTTASSATSTTSTTSTASKQTTTKPVISVTNDSNLYMATQVGNDGTYKKKSASMKYLDSEEEDFKRHDFNPGSRRALEHVYTCHPDFYQLNSKILDEGSLLKQDVLDIFRKSGETLTYEQLLQGMLVDGERFLLGNCWLYYTHVQFLDVEGTKILREPYGRGRIGLTSKRTLFLSTETFTDASLESYGEPTKRKDGGYKLEVSKKSNVVFKNIPLSNFHSAEMEVVSGTSVLTKITKKAMCFGCFGTSSSAWDATPPTTRSINSRVLRVGVSMPPWQTRMFMDIYLDSTMSLTVARDFISQLHQFAPHMH